MAAVKLPGRSRPVLMACPNCKDTSFNLWTVESTGQAILTCRNCKTELGRFQTQMLT